MRGKIDKVITVFFFLSFTTVNAAEVASQLRTRSQRISCEKSKGPLPGSRADRSSDRGQQLAAFSFSK